MNCFVYNWTIFVFFFSFIHKQKASKYYSSDDVISFLQDASAEQKYGWWLKFDKREASS